MSVYGHRGVVYYGPGQTYRSHGKLVIPIVADTKEELVSTVPKPEPRLCSDCLVSYENIVPATNASGRYYWCRTKRCYSCVNKHNTVSPYVYAVYCPLERLLKIGYSCNKHMAYLTVKRLTGDPDVDMFWTYEPGSYWLEQAIQSVLGSWGWSAPIVRLRNRGQEWFIIPEDVDTSALTVVLDYIVHQSELTKDAQFDILRTEKKR